MAVLQLVHGLAAFLPSPVYNFGARRSPHHVHRPSVADVLGVTVIGCDREPGAGVDRLEDLQAMTLTTGSVGTALMLDVLEHVERPWEALAELARVLQPGGVLVLTTHFCFPYHPDPEDYWRFTRAALRRLVERTGMTVIALVDAGVPLLPHTVAAVAIKDPLPSHERVTNIAEVTRAWTVRAGAGWRERLFDVLPPVISGRLYGGYVRWLERWSVWGRRGGW